MLHKMKAEIRVKRKDENRETRGKRKEERGKRKIAICTSNSSKRSL